MFLINIMAPEESREETFHEIYFNIDHFIFKIICKSYIIRK